MSQNQVHEKHEMSHALYEDLAALKIRIAFAEISEAELDDYDRELYNGPLVKTSNEDLKVNIRSKACPVIIVAGNQRRHEKLICESPLTMGLGRLG